MRAALDGSVPIVTLTFIFGFRSASVAVWPFTVISVNLVTPYVLLVLSNTLPPLSATTCVSTVIELAVTAEIAVTWCVGVGVGRGFVEVAPTGRAGTNRTLNTPTSRSNEQDFFAAITSYTSASRAAPVAWPVRFPLPPQS